MKMQGVAHIEEDSNLEICKHSWKPLDYVSGFSHSTDRYIINFYCEGCLMIRKKIIDVSDQHVPAQVIADFDHDDEVTSG